MFDKIKKGLRGSVSKDDEAATTATEPFDFNSDIYHYPMLYEEADEMLQVALLIYTMTDLRSLAKKKNTKLSNPEKVLTLPLNLATCLEMIEENLDLIKAEVGDADHMMTMSALQSIQERYESQSLTTSGHWASPFAGDSGFDVSLAPQLIWYGDENPVSDLVYAVGMDPIRKRVTVAFRGSVTPSDFMTDANITLNRRKSPISGAEEDETIGIHHGFHEYLLKERKGGQNKYNEIMTHVQQLFEDPERRSTYRLYVTGHSLGGSLATLFAFFAAASATDIPTPVTCVSVASPRVGEGTFQRAFSQLEKEGKLRHLRIANDKDPVTVMPKSSSKKVWALLSPVSYVAFKFSDKDFAEKETYRHTGMKLKLRKNGTYEIAYSGVSKEEQGVEVSSSKSSSKLLSFRQKKLPGVVYHFGNVYCDNLVSVKDELAGMTLNELYQSKAATVIAAREMNDGSDDDDNESS